MGWYNISPVRREWLAKIFIRLKGFLEMLCRKGNSGSEQLSDVQVLNLA